MPKGPRGEKRPADVIGAAVMVGRIATGEIEENRPQESAAAELGRKGGQARAQKALCEKTQGNCEESAGHLLPGLTLGGWI
jgi:hypothetical protein